MTVSRSMLGFDRKVRLRWLDLTAEGLLLGDSLPALRARLRKALSHDVKDNGSGGALGKTLTVLLRVWASPTPALRAFRDEALRLYGDTPSDQTLWLHWGMVMATHPFMFEVATHAGRLLALQDDVSLAEVRLRMIERWGDRSTLQRAVQRVMWNLAEWEALKPTSTRSVYQARPRRAPPSDAVQVWMIEALLRAQGSSCISLRQVETAPALFPFALHLTVSEMRKSRRIELSRQGANVDMVALR